MRPNASMHCTCMKRPQGWITIRTSIAPCSKSVPSALILASTQTSRSASFGMIVLAKSGGGRLTPACSRAREEEGKGGISGDTPETRCVSPGTGSARQQWPTALRLHSLKCVQRMFAAMAYETIDGVTYEKELLELAHQHTTGRGEANLSKEEVAELFASAADGPGITETEKATLAYIRRHFSFTEAAAKEFDQRFAAL